MFKQTPTEFVETIRRKSASPNDTTTTTQQTKSISKPASFAPTPTRMNEGRDFLNMTNNSEFSEIQPHSLFQRSPIQLADRLSVDSDSISSSVSTSTSSTYTPSRSTRAVAKPISYAATPLSKKIRKGHQFFKFKKEDTL
jgi:hypothetical protein